MSPRILLASLLALLAGPSLVAQTTITTADGGSAQIRRDRYGAPHITATTDQALFTAQGWGAAEDRIVQLELHRRQAEGRLAELFGLGYASSDEAVRVRLFTDAERRRIVDTLEPTLRSILQWYADGINRYIDSMYARPEIYMPLEVAQTGLFTGLTMEHWRVENSLAIAQYMIGELGAFGGDELQNLQMLNVLGEDYFELFAPLNDSLAYSTIIDVDRAPKGEEPRLQRGGERWRRQRSLMVDSSVTQRVGRYRERLFDAARSIGAPVKLGSIGLLVLPEQTRNGLPLLLGAPQMSYNRADSTETNITHEVELKSPSLHVGGMAVAGLPMVILGRTGQHAWTLMSGASDNTDIFLDSADATFTKYWHKGEWHDLELLIDTIVVGSGQMRQRQPVEVRRGVHGPVLAIDTANGWFVSRRTTFRGEELSMLEAVLAMSRAGSVDEFQQGVAMLPSSFNVLYADRAGNTRYWHAGRYVLAEPDVDPRLPRVGDGSMEWTGFRPFSSLPSATTSSRGYFANWNNKPAPWWNNGDNIPWTRDSYWTQLGDSLDAAVQSLLPMTFEKLTDVLRGVDDHGTYEERFEFASDSIWDENVVAPGQSAWVALDGTAGPHVFDQWAIWKGWGMKDQEFGEASSGVPVEIAAGSLAARPNPTSGEVRFEVGGRSGGRISVEVVDALGRVVRRLEGRGEALLWDGLTVEGTPAPAGLYLARVTVDGATRTLPLVMTR